MKQFKIGKGDTNDIIINDPTVSREHLAVFIDDENNFFITDLGSTNGTYVNGVRIEKSEKLETLDVLRIGNSLVDWPRFLIDDDNLEQVYQTLNDEKELLKIKNKADSEKNIFENKLFDIVLNLKLPFFICFVLFCISFILPVLKEFEILGYEVALSSLKDIDSIDGIMNSLANALILFTFILKRRINYKIKIAFLIIFFAVSSRFLLNNFLSEFSLGYFFWYTFGTFSMLFFIYMNKDKNQLIKGQNKKNKIQELIPLWSISTIAFVILLSFLLNHFFVNDSNSSEDNNNYKEFNSEKVRGIVSNKHQQRKQRTSVTYDFSCLSSDEEIGSNEIYNFGEITRNVQNTFFDDIEISVSDEEKNGQELLNSLKKEYKFIEKGVEFENLNSILKNLISRLAKPRGFNYKIFFIDEPIINAYTSGGHIFFFKGMYEFCTTNSEIAAIISHEIAHNELGHLTLSTKKQKAANDWGFAGKIVFEVGNLFESLFTQSFNQKQESEADLFGMDLVYPTNLKNCDAINFWKRMSQDETKYDVIDNFNRSHPYSKNRAKCINNHLKSNYNINCN